MSIDFKSALLYPFRDENRRDMIWFPGIAVYLVGVFFLILFFLSGFSLFGGSFLENLAQVEEGAASPEFNLFYGVFQILQTVPNLAFGILAYGYLWQMCDRWQTQGYDAPAIHWFDDLTGLFRDGCKMLLYYILASLFMILPLAGIVLVGIFLFGLNAALFNQQPVLATGFSFVLILVALLLVVALNLLISPFIYGPAIASAQSRRLADLFNLTRGWRLAIQNYKSALWATLGIIGLGLTYLAGMLALLLPCCLGLLLFPFFSMSFYVSMAHLANHGLWREASPSAGAGNAPPQIISG